MKKLRKIPKFKNEDMERKFWDAHDLTDYFDMSRAERVFFPNLKPSTESISLRVPQSLLFEIKGLANRQDVPYQSLIKIFLSEKVEQLKAKSRR